jgi:hypothetical protein
MAKTMTLREELLYKMHVFEGRWEKFAKKNDLEVRFIGNEDFYKLVERAAVIRATLRVMDYWSKGGVVSWFDEWDPLNIKDVYKNLDIPGFSIDPHVRQFLHDAYNFELSMFNDSLHDAYSKLQDRLYREARAKTLDTFYKEHRDMYCGISEKDIAQAYDEYVNCGKDW